MTGIRKMTDLILVNTPISSPLHAQLNLPLLKGAMEAEGISTRIVDSNIDFYIEFMGSDRPHLGSDEFRENPLSLLAYFNSLENLVWEKSQEWPELQIGLRSLAMKQERLFCDSVFEATQDEASNPFIKFYERLVQEDFSKSNAKAI